MAVLSRIGRFRNIPNIPEVLNLPKTEMITLVH